MKLLRIMIIGLMLAGVCGYLFAQIPPEQKEAETEEEKEPLEKDITEVLPAIEVTRLEAKEPLYSIELRNASLTDFFRLIAHDYDFNILIDERVKGTITASFTNISLEAAMKNIADMYELTLEKKKGVIIVKPNLITKTILFKHIDAQSFLEGVAAASLGSQASEGTASNREVPTSGEGAGPTSVYELLSDLGQILLGRQRNLIMVIDYPKNVKKIEDFAKAVDGSMASKVFKLKYISSKTLATEFKEQAEEEEGFVLREVSETEGSSSSGTGSSGTSGTSY